MVAYGPLMSELPDAGSFGAAFVEFMRVMSLVAEERESEVAVRLREHLGTDPKGLPTTGAEFPLAEHPNLQLALDAVLGDAELVGFHTRHMGFGSIGLAEIVAGQGMAGPISFGPVRYVDVEVGDGRVVQCVESALLLAVREEAPLALVLSRGGDNPMRPSSLRLEGVSPAPGAVSGLLRELRAAMREHNVFRGRIISLHQGDQGGSVGVQFHAVPTVTRTDVILPEGTLERLERHTLGITQSARRLRAAPAPQAWGAAARAAWDGQDALDDVPAPRDGRPHDHLVDRPRARADRAGAGDRPRSRAGDVRF